MIDSESVNEIYNISGANEQTNKETIQQVISHFLNHNEQGTEDWSSYVNFDYDRIGQDVRYSVDDSKLKSLGWHPKKVFKEEIESIVKFYMENTRWA